MTENKSALVTENKSALVPVTEGDARRDALLRALGFDKLSEGQRELALAISQQYDLDPMLRHVVMVDGKPYITRDGLLHVAHKSGDFDGIEVDRPTLDTDGKYWRTQCRVYRKSFSRPFIYPGRYPALGGNTKYNEEMAIKVAEVMTLRRAFDVSAPVMEERWDGDFEAEIEPVAPVSFSERVAQRALAASASQEQPETGASEPVVLAIVEPETTVPEPEPDDPVEVVPEEEEVDEGEYEEVEEDEPAPPIVTPIREEMNLDSQQAPTDDSDPIDHFKSWARDHDQALIRSVAREMFPTLTGFSQLEAGQFAAIQREVLKAEATRDEASASERCAAPSPLTSSVCTLDPDHKGVHRHGTREAW